jgi:hypothetical protein
MKLEFFPLLNDKKHLPESLSTDLENLAENILGQQYAKYLK